MATNRRNKKSGKIKMKAVKSQEAEPNGKQTGVGDGLENFTMG